MPIGEIESHPYLDTQLNSPGFDLNAITKMIVGTFPIYCITNSIPIEPEGLLLRANWQQKAFYQFFYGSKKNYMRQILGSLPLCNIPNNVNAVLGILNARNIFMTDCIVSCDRNGYSSDDSDLVHRIPNNAIIQHLATMPNLQTIVFTSDEAKELFCGITGIADTGRIQNINYDGRQIALRTLPSPAGNGRSVWTYIDQYPLIPAEQIARDSGQPYAIGYRQRLYHAHL